MDDVVHALVAASPAGFLGALLTVVVAAGLIMLIGWRIIGGYERIKRAIQEMIDTALERQSADVAGRFAQHFRDEDGWRERVEGTQRETLARVAALSSRVEDVATELADVKALVRGMESERASRHELEEVARRQIEALLRREENR